MLSLILIPSFLSVFTLVIAIQQRDAPKSRYFIVLTLLIVAYCLGRTFESAATSLDAAYFGVILAYLGLPFIPVAILLFILDYYDIKINKLLLLPVWIPLILTSIFVTVPELRHFYYAEYSFMPGPPFGQIVVEGTKYYYAMFGYHALLSIVCLTLALWGAIKFNKTERWSSLVVFLAVIFPSLFEVLYVLRMTPMQLELTPIALSISLILLCIAIFRLNLLRVLPLAKDTILEQMSDPFIIVDIEKRFLEANAAAKNLFPSLINMRVGQTLDIGDFFPEVSEGLDGRKLVSMMVDKEQQYYHLSETAIEQNTNMRCLCYTLHDVTDTRKLMAELKTMATYDAMTNIYNRASFYEFASQELERSAAQRTPISALAIDIDRFKDINDTYGHHCGDIVIKGIVDKIAKRLRKADIFGRVGGDEFNIVLPNTNQENAERLAQILQKIVNAEPFIFENQDIIASISIGVAEFDEQRHPDLEHLLMDIDSALYMSKNSGRNMVCTYSTEAQPMS